MTDFLSMGGYGGYVWGSYGVAFLVILLEILSLIRRSKKSHETPA